MASFSIIVCYSYWIIFTFLYSNLVIIFSFFSRFCFYAHPLGFSFKGFFFLVLKFPWVFITSSVYLLRSRVSLLLNVKVHFFHFISSYGHRDTHKTILMSYDKIYDRLCSLWSMQVAYTGLCKHNSLLLWFPSHQIPEVYSPLLDNQELALPLIHLIVRYFEMNTWN
jgi:hypothetical protein